MFLLSSCVIGCLFVSINSLTLDIPDRPLGKEKKVQDLIVRLLGEDRASYFQIKIIKSWNRQAGDVVKISKRSQSSAVEILASSGPAAAYGFHHYLKYHLSCHVSWDGDQLDLPTKEEMPVVQYELQILDQFRYNMNVCTYGYSYVWWNWTRWEREIDWMALNGFNLALAFTGTEAVWKDVYLELGYTEEDIDDFFTGPAFLPWNRMGNVRGSWTGAKLSSNWHTNQIALQRKILKRMRSLGILPIFPGFSGFLPRATSRLFPDANITYAGRWNGFEDKFCCPAMLLPTDPLFLQVGSLFVKKLMKLFGTNHLYSADPFNEMVPSTEDVQVLRQYGQSIFAAMAAEDPHAIWVLQGWMFKHDADYWTSDKAEAILTSADVGKILVLDLQAELVPQYQRTESFYGQPFIWCMLHNFGGTLGLQGAIRRATTYLDEARSLNNTMVGIGITMEGIGTNYVVYDYFSDLAVSMPRQKWFEDYPTRRYGERNADAIAAWEIMLDTVYDYNDQKAPHGQYVFNNRPSPNKKVRNWFVPNQFYDAWQSMLRASTTLGRLNELFLGDLVDVTREALRLKIDELYLNIVDAYKAKDLARINAGSAKILQILDDMDMILGSNRRFLLGPWLEDAKAMGSTPLEKNVYERDARNQISSWGPKMEILDYANKQWAGVVKDYYKPRWLQFLRLLKQSTTQRTKFDSEALNKECSDIEEHFTMSRKLHSTQPHGNTKHMALEIFKKWRHVALP